MQHNSKYYVDKTNEISQSFACTYSPIMFFICTSNVLVTHRVLANAVFRVYTYTIMPSWIMTTVLRV